MWAARPTKFGLMYERADQVAAELGHVHAGGMVDPVLVELGPGHRSLLRKSLARVGNAGESLVEVVVVHDGGLTDLDWHASKVVGASLRTIDPLLP